MPPNNSDKSTTINPPKLLDQVRNKLRVKHYSIRTEQSYTDWIKRYILFHGKCLTVRCGELVNWFCFLQLRYIGNLNTLLTKGMHHIGLTVSKLEESAGFFTSLLG